MGLKTRPTLLCAAGLLLVVACGKPSSFSSKKDGAIAEPSPTPAPAVSQPRAPFQGYEQPELRGSAAQTLGGPAVLGLPEDPDENPVVTAIENGRPPNIAGVTSPVTDKTTGIACASGIVVGDTCFPAVGVTLWNLTASTSESRGILSTRNANCDKTADAVCDALQTRGASLGYRASGTILFSSVRPPETPSPEVKSLLKEVLLCHGSLVSPSPGAESIQTPGVACATTSETLWGFVSPATWGAVATVPAYQWSNGSNDTISLSKDLAPATGYSLKSPNALFHVLPPR